MYPGILSQLQAQVSRFGLVFSGERRPNPSHIDLPLGALGELLRKPGGTSTLG